MPILPPAGFKCFWFKIKGGAGGGVFIILGKQICSVLILTVIWVFLRIPRVRANRALLDAK